MKDFKKLKIWQRGMDIVDAVYDLLPKFPSEEKFGMKSQTARSAVSIPANIAEGSAKKSGRDYYRFVEISLGSAFELETHLLIVQRRGWIEGDEISDLLHSIKTEQQMLVRFLERL